MAMKLIDITDERHGTLVAVAFDRREKGVTHWKCKCDCGEYHTVILGNFRRGQSTACPKCRINKGPYKHGLSKTREQPYWQRNRHKMCQQWKDDLLVFIDESNMRDNIGLSIVPIEPRRPIGPDNFVWQQTKQKNTRGRFWKYNGERGNMAFWGEKLGLTRERIRQLIDKHGSIRAVIRHREQYQNILGKRSLIHLYVKREDYNSLWAKIQSAANESDMTISEWSLLAITNALPNNEPENNR